MRVNLGGICKLWLNFYKMRRSRLQCRTKSVKKCKDLTIRLKVNYLFPTSSSGSSGKLSVASKSASEENISGWS